MLIIFPLPQKSFPWIPGYRTVLSNLSRLVTFAASRFELIFVIGSAESCRTVNLCLSISSWFFFCHSGIGVVLQQVPPTTMIASRLLIKFSGIEYDDLIRMVKYLIFYLS